MADSYQTTVRDMLMPHIEAFTEAVAQAQEKVVKLGSPAARYDDYFCFPRTC